MKKPLLFLLSFFALNLFADPYENLCKTLLQPKPSLPEYSTLFSDTFKKQASEESLLRSFEGVYAKTGACTRKTLEKSPKGQFYLHLYTDHHWLVHARFQINPEGKITTFQITELENEKEFLSRWEDLEKEYKAFDPEGKFSALLMTLDQKTQSLSGTREPLAAGSGFKLYVLGALVDSIQKGERSWDTQLMVRDDWKSLSEGMLQVMPGTKFPLYYFAEQMISISDNSATDHLLYSLGREKVEKILPVMHAINPKTQLPMISTSEMMKLKWAIDPKQTEEYLKANNAQKKKILEQLSSVSLSKIGTNGVSTEVPTHIDSIEWFYTTNELCQAMFWLHNLKSKEVNEILSVNDSGLLEAEIPSSPWKFVGFKGGSEPGVLTLTYLLETKSGKVGCVSLATNNTKKIILTDKFIDLGRKALRLSAKLLE